MKKLLILIIILALSSTLLLTACAPDEPETLYGKPKLSQMSDEELLKVINAFLNDENTHFWGNKNDDTNSDLSRIREKFSVMEKYHTEYVSVDNHGDIVPFVFYYYEINLKGNHKSK